MKPTRLELLESLKAAMEELEEKDRLLAAYESGTKTPPSVQQEASSKKASDEADARYLEMEKRLERMENLLMQSLQKNETPSNPPPRKRQTGFFDEGPFDWEYERREKESDYLMQLYNLRPEAERQARRIVERAQDYADNITAKAERQLMENRREKERLMHMTQRLQQQLYGILDDSK